MLYFNTDFVRRHEERPWRTHCEPQLPYNNPCYTTPYYLVETNGLAPISAVVAIDCYVIIGFWLTNICLVIFIGLLTRR